MNFSSMLKMLTPIQPPQPASSQTPETFLSGRIIDFSDRAIRRSLKTGPLQPYEPFLPELSFGFELCARTRLRLAKAEDEMTAMFCDIETGSSRWLTLEMAFDPEKLQRSGAAFAMIEAAAAPRIAVKAVLRTPNPKAVEGFVDCEPVSFVIDSALRKTSLSFTVSLEDLRPQKEDREAQLIIFMPLRNFSLCLRRLTFAPIGV
jgi:hypothetical protein